MSIQSEINRIAGAKSDIADAIEDMGGTLSPGASIDDMAAGVRTIPQGTSDYTDLTNKPQINSVTLTGNKTGADLGLVNAVTGKQLSTEDYTTAEKTKLAGIEAQANKTVIDDTLTNTGEAADAKAVGDALVKKAPIIYDTASGDIASFPDGADGLPVKDLTVAIEPVQSGMGDPSPTNVRPISGWTGANVTRTGKNLLKWYAVGETKTQASVTGTVQEDGGIKLTGTASGTWWGFGDSPTCLLKAGTYTLNQTGTSSGGIQTILVDHENTTVLKSVSGTIQSAFFTLSRDTVIHAYNKVSSSTTTECTIYSWVESGSTATAYEPYSGTTLPISWQSEAGTVYGGTLDATSGVLTVTDANIASYNGETLPGEWISDRDVYAAGATPTTGAQVVYKLAVPQTYQLDPVTVNTLLGQNNIWADCGPSTVEYPCDTKTYVDNGIDKVENTLNSKADEASLALRRSGATNTGAQIESGTYFYLDGTLKQAIATIAQNASFTAQNCETVTDGGLNSLKNESGNGYCKMPDGTLIQWGEMSGLTVDLQAEVTSGLYYQLYTTNNGIVFPVSFKNDNYVVSGSFQYSTGSPFPITVGYNARTKTFCYPTLRDVYPRSGNLGAIAWQAVGRWK